MQHTSLVGLVCPFQGWILLLLCHSGDTSRPIFGYSRDREKRYREQVQDTRNVTKRPVAPRSRAGVDAQGEEEEEEEEEESVKDHSTPCRLFRSGSTAQPATWTWRAEHLLHKIGC